MTHDPYLCVIVVFFLYCVKCIMKFKTLQNQHISAGLYHLFTIKGSHVWVPTAVRVVQAGYKDAHKAIKEELVWTSVAPGKP